MKQIGEIAQQIVDELMRQRKERDEKEGKMRWRVHLVCPRCDKTHETIINKYPPEPHMNCGDCLMDFVEIVPMTIVAIEQEEGDAPR